MTSTLAMLAVVTVLLSGCSADSDTADPWPTPVAPGLVAGDLVAAESCDQLLDYYISHAVDMVGPYGLDGYDSKPRDFFEPTATTAAASTFEAPDGPDFTGTNNQVHGVDEADVLKNDGRFLYLMMDGMFRIAEPTRDGVRLAGTLRLDWWPQAMLHSGDTVLLIGAVFGGGPMPLHDGFAAPSWQGSMVRLMEIDVSDRNRPTIGRVVEFDGSYVAARMVDDTVRITINSSPVGLPWVHPRGAGLQAERVATMANQALVRSSTLENWLPFYVAGERTTDSSLDAGQLLDCQNVMIPAEFSGLGTLSILSFDLSRGLTDWASAGVVASGSTVYATPAATYVATQRWFDWVRGDGQATPHDGTDIHVFDTAEFKPRYVASGRVDGFLLGQFAMDEHDGFLRVASTAASGATSESKVTILARGGEKLVTIGQVGGLGRDEQIYAVRFLGDVGYVVTFRQVDPLYTIDLANPKSPRVAGELKITGYSAYLHPIGDGLLLGLGQEASEEGRIEGTQLSLFDVSDPAQPIRLDRVTLDGGWSAAEHDHKAFTYVDGLALAPYESWAWNDDEKDTYDNGVIAVRVESSRLRLETILRADENRRINHPVDAHLHVPVRTTVVDGRIYTLTRGGIAVHDASSFRQLAYETF